MAPDSGPAPYPRGTRNAARGTLVIQTAWLGDVVLTLPLIQSLAARFGPVDVLVTPSAVPLVEQDPAVRRAIAWDKRGAGRGAGGLLRLAAALRRAGYGRAFLPHRSLRSALLARLAGIPERTGYAGSGLASFLYTARVARPPVGHEPARLLALAGTAARPGTPWFTVTARDRERAAGWLDRQGVRRPFVVLAPGARWATKLWPGYPELARRLDLQAVVVGGAEERPLARLISEAVPGRASSAAGELTLRESAAVIEQATLVVTNDSAPLHLAVALARPVIAIAGPTGPAPGFEPPATVGRVVAHPDLACRPCSAHGPERCPLGHHRSCRSTGSWRWWSRC
jgi:heptosyltransferase-2